LCRREERCKQASKHQTNTIQSRCALAAVGGFVVEWLLVVVQQEGWRQLKTGVGTAVLLSRCSGRACRSVVLSGAHGKPALCRCNRLQALSMFGRCSTLLAAIQDSAQVRHTCPVVASLPHNCHTHDCLNTHGTACRQPVSLSRRAGRPSPETPAQTRRWLCRGEGAARGQQRHKHRGSCVSMAVPQLCSELAVSRLDASGGRAAAPLWRRHLLSPLTCQHGEVAQALDSAQQPGGSRRQALACKTWAAACCHHARTPPSPHHARPPVQRTLACRDLCVQRPGRDAVDAQEAHALCVCVCVRVCECVAATASSGRLLDAHTHTRH
jgi:hypothetical protein